MTDILIRNVPAEDVSALDDRAAQLGLSRNEFLRRQLHTEARRSGPTTVAVTDLVFVQDLLVDLVDEDVMQEAWS